MAKAPLSDDDAPKKKRRGASVMAWVLMAMLIAGLGGFGVSSFGGGVTAIGRVGDREIAVNDYASALRQQLDAFSQQVGQPIGLAQAQALGLDRQVLEGVINRAAMDNEAAQIGLSVGDATVAAKLTGIAGFQGVAGGFDRATYRDALQRSNLTEAGFEANLRADTARQVLETVISGGITAPAALTDTIAAWAGEQRGFSMLRLTSTSLPTPLPAATDADLMAYYTANIATYTRPEAKQISYVALLPDDLAQDMPVDDAELQKVYAARLSDYVIPEKRLVERLGFATEADAIAARARLDAGTSFDALVAERNLTLDDVDMGDVSKSELGDAGEGVFALIGPGIAGPLPSAVGPALFRMNAILTAQETTFDQAKPDLAREVQIEAARKAIADRVEAVDDALAGGATLADVAKEQAMTLATTDYAPGADDNDAITAYKAFRDAAAKLAEGDFPQAILLEDGGLVALQLEKILPPTPVPFDKVKEKVSTAQTATALASALATQAATITTAVKAGAALGSYGIIDRVAQIDRQGFVKDAPDTLLPAVFEMKPNEVRLIEGPGFAALVQLNTVNPAPTTGEDATAMREAIATNSARAIAEDTLALYTSALTAQAGITLDQAAINAVHAQFGQ